MNKSLKAKRLEVKAALIIEIERTIQHLGLALETGNIDFNDIHSTRQHILRSVGVLGLQGTSLGKELVLLANQLNICTDLHHLREHINQIGDMWDDIKKKL